VNGFEGVGVFEGVDEGAAEFWTGNRVAYAIPPLASYAKVRNYPADKLLNLPDELGDREVEY
jgi:NADPH2:quinone reductase